MPGRLALAMAVGLAGCGGGPQTGEIGALRGFLGGVAADEPRAVLVARDMLSAGGTAADAAVALYFALSVTLPSVASLGGGGVCLVFDPRSNWTEALDFLARAPAGSASRAAVPGNPRGMFALHAKYGRLRWEQVVAPAENLARFGAPVSRTLAHDLAAAAPRLAQDPGLRQIFLRPDGTPPAEGQVLVQGELSSVLSAIRARGPGELYAGPLGRQFVAATQSVGAAISLEDLRGALPQWRPPVTLRFDDLSLHFAPPPAIGGLAAAQLWSMLGPRWRSVPAEERPHLFAEAAQRGAYDRGRWLEPDLTTALPAAEILDARRAGELMAGYRADRRAPPAAVPPPAARADGSAAASFVVADREGGAVACAVTSYERFGLGRVAPGTGIVLAGAPGGGAQGLGPMLAINSRDAEFVFAGAATGGAAGTDALVAVALRALADRRSLEEAIEASRLSYTGVPDIVLVEGEMPGLGARGYGVRPAAWLGRVNAILCPDGLVNRPATCQSRADRRGFGLGWIGG
ncbi:MAG: gamma-glutamyltransferase [Pseudomonadota bacterium]